MQLHGKLDKFVLLILFSANIFLSFSCEPTMSELSGVVDAGSNLQTNKFSVRTSEILVNEANFKVKKMTIEEVGPKPEKVFTHELSLAKLRMSEDGPSIEASRPTEGWMKIADFLKSDSARLLAMNANEIAYSYGNKAKAVAQAYCLGVPTKGTIALGPIISGGKLWPLKIF